MSRKRPPPRLSEDDLAVWRKVAQSADPLHPIRHRAVEPDEDTEPQTIQPPEPRATMPSFRIGERAVYDHSKGHDLSTTLETRLAAEPLRMDKRVFGRMKRGKLRPDRKIDLHGMTLAQAHPALSRFVIAAQADGCRLLLVVTGKGSTGRPDDGPIPAPRGILRQQVPQWLRMAPLGALILQVTDAHRNHGGSGAYYVYLRRRSGAG